MVQSAGSESWEEAHTLPQQDAHIAIEDELACLTVPSATASPALVVVITWWIHSINRQKLR